LIFILILVLHLIINPFYTVFLKTYRSYL
jgi:hypothetical protein